ncbi:MAG: hypothetical protein GY854_00210 [Deltaproteobacteria bacterium]|nr:hypothetical protein [Deltaproteobacteria bacterium]
MNTISTAFILVAIGLATLVGCRGEDEAEAIRLCRKAEALEKSDLKESLELRRRIWERMPTFGTNAAAQCVRYVREKMGRMRVIITRDETGAKESVDACAWVALAMEVFEGSGKPPFRRHWAERMMETCVTVVGRAWTRRPDSSYYAEQTTRFKGLSGKSTSP